VRTERVPSLTSDDDGAATATGLEPTAARRESTYSYGPHPRHKLTAYYVKRSTRQPAVVLVHGGYWYEGDKSSFTDFARHLVGKGYAVFAINYRLNTQAGWQAQRQDVYQATQWVKAHAAAFSINPQRVVLVGNSAGGHLVTSLGVYSTGTRYAKAVAAISPVANPYRAYQDGQRPGSTVYERKLRDTALLLARCTPDPADTTCWRRWTDLVSFQHASRGDTPMLLIHSRHDFVPPSHGAQLCRELQTDSVACSPVVVAGDEHGMGLLARTSVRDRLVRWLKAHD
jgi:acetyl esterase/lipase